MKAKNVKLPATLQTTVTRENRTKIKVSTAMGVFDIALYNMQDIAYKHLSIDLPYTPKLEGTKLTLAHDAGQISVDVGKSPIYQFIAQCINTK